MTIILGGLSGYGRIHLPRIRSFHSQQTQVQLIVLLKIENLKEKVKERNLRENRKK